MTAENANTALMLLVAFLGFAIAFALVALGYAIGRWTR